MSESHAENTELRMAREPDLEIELPGRERWRPLLNADALFELDVCRRDGVGMCCDRGPLGKHESRRHEWRLRHSADREAGDPAHAESTEHGGM